MLEPKCSASRFFLAIFATEPPLSVKPISLISFPVFSHGSVTHPSPVGLNLALLYLHGARAVSFEG
jgi:hypothetical protein